MSLKKAIKCYSHLKVLAGCKSHDKRKKYLKKCPKCIYAVISDIAKQILNGTIKLKPLIKNRLKRYKNQMRKLASKSSLSLKKKIVNQKGGLLPGLLWPAVSLLAHIVSDKLS